MTDKTPHVEDVEHEVIDIQEDAQTDEALPIEKVIASEIKKFSLPDKAIAEMKAKFSGLKINGVDDTKGFKEVSAARAFVRTRRTSLEKKRKELKASYLETGRGIDAEAKRLTDLLLEIEIPLDNQIKEIEDIKEREKEEKLKAENERLQARVTSLIDNGVKFSGAFYTIGESISLDVVTIKEMPDEQFNTLLDRVKVENKKIQDAENERLRIEEENRLLLQKQKEEQEQERQRLENEKAEMRKQRTELRISILENFGFDRGATSLGMYFKDAGSITISIGDFADLSGEEWDKRFLDIKTTAGKLRQLQAEKDEAERQRQENVAKLRERDKQRRKVFADLGLIEDEGQIFIRTTSFGDTDFYNVVKLFEESDEEFNADMEEIKQAIEVTRRKDRENLELEERKKGRADILQKGYGFEFKFLGDNRGQFFKNSKYPILIPAVTVWLDELALQTDEEFNVFLNDTIKPALKDLETREAAETKKREQEIEDRRQAALSDIEKINEFFAAIDPIKVPVILNAKVSAAFNLYLESIANSKAILFKTLDAIK